MKPIDVGALLDEGQWKGYLKFLVFLTALTVVFDGGDVQLAGLAVPSMMKEWGLQRSDFSFLLATGMAGMMIGGSLGGMLGDRFGRKVALIGSVVVFSVMTLAVAAIDSLRALMVLRFLAGLGLGGAMPNAAALAAEFVPRRQRSFAVTLTIVCVPVGGMAAAYLASQIVPVPGEGWRKLFVIGGAAPLAVAVLLCWLLVESPRYLARHPVRWPDLVRLLRRAGHHVPDGSTFIDSAEKAGTKVSVGELFNSGFRRDTIALWFAFFSCLLAVYTSVNWLPSLLSGAGLTIGSKGLQYFNQGGVVGAILGGFLISRVGSRPIMLTMAAAAVATGIVLANTTINKDADTGPILIMLTVLGALINAVQVMIYALAAHVYPSAVRSTGVGTAVSFGRIGGVLSPYVGSWALEGASGNSHYFIVIAAAMASAFISISLVKRHVQHTAAAGKA